MAKRSKQKEVQQVNLNKDTRQILKELAENAGLSISTYTERLILEKYWSLEKENNNETE